MTYCWIGFGFWKANQNWYCNIIFSVFQNKNIIYVFIIEVGSLKKYMLRKYVTICYMIITGYNINIDSVFKHQPKVCQSHFNAEGWWDAPWDFEKAKEHLAFWADLTLYLVTADYAWSLGDHWHITLWDKMWHRNVCKAAVTGLQSTNRGSYPRWRRHPEAPRRPLCFVLAGVEEAAAERRPSCGRVALTKWGEAYRGWKMTNR